ncbi:unnamed protein product [marine sediment metagenome]|uniref:Uncharacterized protein n=1 Tax=marine sediment metagenome TaxID=412755 RepID=X0YT40_9ZZZZ
MEQGNRPLEVYENIKSVLKVDNINVSDYKLIDYGLQFTVSILDWSGVIRIYQNKKGILKIGIFNNQFIGKNNCLIK